MRWPTFCTAQSFRDPGQRSCRHIGAAPAWACPFLRCSVRGKGETSPCKGVSNNTVTPIRISLVRTSPSDPSNCEVRRKCRRANGMFELLCHGALNIIRVSSLLPPPDFSSFISKVAFTFRINIIILVLETA